MDNRKAAAAPLRPFCIARTAARGCLLLSQLIRGTRATAPLTPVLTRYLCALWREKNVIEKQHRLTTFRGTVRTPKKSADALVFCFSVYIPPPRLRLLLNLQ
jgi:hypothetical protein